MVRAQHRHILERCAVYALAYRIKVVHIQLMSMGYRAIRMLAFSAAG